MQRHLALRRAAGADQISAFRTSSALFVPPRLYTMLPVNNNRFAISAAPNFWCASASSRSSLTRVRGALSERRESTYFFFSKSSAAEINRGLIFLYIYTCAHTRFDKVICAIWVGVKRTKRADSDALEKSMCMRISRFLVMMLLFRNSWSLCSLLLHMRHFKPLKITSPFHTSARSYY